MCTPFDPRIAYGFAIVGAIVATASFRQTRAGIADERGFTFPEVGMFVGIVGLAILMMYLFFARCVALEAAPGNMPTPLPAGAVQSGAAAPAGTRAPACETGYICARPGRACAFGGSCTITYEWDPQAAKWRCDCGCR